MLTLSRPAIEGFFHSVKAKVRAFSVALMCAVAPSVAFGHTVTARTADRTSEWLGAGIPILCAAVLYGLGWLTLRARRAPEPRPPWRALAFTAGLVTLTLALRQD